MARPFHFVPWLVVWLALACQAGREVPAQAPPVASTEQRKIWLVVAPHPDDEALIASGVIQAALARHESVQVAMVTNGDFDCIHSGEVRQGESVSGMAAVGLNEDALHFFGYPDGGLSRLGEVPLQAKRKVASGDCALVGSTYASRGRGRLDLHSRLNGESAAYTWHGLVLDLAAVLTEVKPDYLVTTHPFDTHPDHALTYIAARQALERLNLATTVLRALVHTGSCFPTLAGLSGECQSTPSFSLGLTPKLDGALLGYGPEFRVPLSAEQVARKKEAIAAHRTQTGGDPGSYLFSFARDDELFFEDRVPPKSSWGSPQEHGMEMARNGDVAELSLNGVPIGRVLLEPGTPAQAEVHVAIAGHSPVRELWVFVGGELRAVLPLRNG